MIDSKVETLGRPPPNGTASLPSPEAKATVLRARRRRVRPAADQGSGPGAWQLQRPDRMRWRFFIGPDAHVEADVKSARGPSAGFVKGKSSRSKPAEDHQTRDASRATRRGALVVLEGRRLPWSHPGPPRGSSGGQGHRVIENPRPAPVVTLRRLRTRSAGSGKFWGEFF